MKLRIIVLSIFTIVYQAQLNGQDAKPLTTVPTPNASSLGQYDKIPVNYFTGAPNISVSIYQAMYRDLKVPIELNYSPSAIKPDQQVGWVGLGWNLMAGGVMTRQRRATEDEEEQYGFFKKYSVLAASDWSSTDKLKSYTTTMDDKYADIFQFSMNGHSGEIIMSHTGNWEVISDESVKVIFDKVNDIMTYNGRKMIRQFALVTSDGTKYTFGGSLDFVEFSYEFLGSQKLEAVASSWYLSKIESPSTKAVIQFSYERGTNGIYLEGELTCAFNKGGFRYRGVASSDGPLDPSCSSWSPTVETKSFQLQSPLYLKEITYSDFKIKFYRSGSGALQYPLSEVTSQLNLLGTALPDNIKQIQSSPEKVKNGKLDSIAIWRNNSYIKSFALEYNNGNIVSTQRLALTQVKEKGRNNEFGSPFQFFYYNLGAVPEFNSHKVDHWGFFNNTYAPPLGVSGQSYFSQREPQAQYTTYGVLNKILFPTRGTVDLDWESHDYGASVPVIRTQPLIIHTSKVVAGGPRIKKMTFTDPVNNSVVEKKFFYVKGYTSSANVQLLPSSGVLAGQNEYRWAGFQALKGSNYATLTYEYESTNNQIPVFSYLNGNHVGYSEVVEVVGSGNGYSVFKYTNFDNGHGDEAYINTLNITGSAYFSYSSRSIERGKLIGEYIYNNADVLNKSTDYEYSDPVGGNSYLRFVDMDFKSLCAGSIILATAYKKFSYKYLLNKKTEKIYRSATDKVETQTLYTYNNYSQVTEQRTNYLSKGESRILKTKYCTDYNLSLCSQQSVECRSNCNESTQDRDELAICLDECDVEQANCENGMNNSPTIKPLLVMRDNNMISYPIETSEFVNKSGTDRIVGAKINFYNYNLGSQLVTLGSQYQLELDPNATSAFTESSINESQFQILKDSKYTLDKIFSIYDVNGNLNEVTGKSGVTSVQLWGYDNRFPLIQVTNSTHTAVVAALGTNAALLSSPQVSDSDVRAIATSLRTSLPNAEISTFTHSPVNGLTSQVDINGKIVYYNYDNLGRLRMVKDNEGNILNQYEYNYQN